MSLVDLLQDTDKQVQGMAAEVISHMSRLSAVRRMLRVQHGIKRIVSIDYVLVTCTSAGRIHTAVFPVKNTAVI